MAFQNLKFNLLTKSKMLNHSKTFLEHIKLRRAVRDFSDKTIPIDLITNAIKAAASCPSGANKQPWHFVVISDKSIKKKIRLAAEKEERAFYSFRASKDWLKDLEPFETTCSKPFLETAPSLIAVFKKIYDVNEKKIKKIIMSMNQLVLLVEFFLQLYIILAWLRLLILHHRWVF